MTHQLDVAGRRDVVARWCDLAEQRLEYLTELFETGRWRRFHSELAFLENIQEARNAVETWRDLSMRDASRDNSAVDISWLGRSTATPPRVETLRVQPMRSEPPPSGVLTAAETDMVLSDDAPSAPDSNAQDFDAQDLDARDLDAQDLNAPVMAPWPNDVSELTRDIAAAIAERYPQLRNAM